MKLSLYQLVNIQSVCFIMLNGVWILPGTISLRYLSLIVGSVISLFILYINKNLLIRKNAISVWIISGIFIWATVHLIFIGKNQSIQYKEYISIWKQAALAAIFALGWGIGLVETFNLSILKNKIERWQNLYTVNWIFYIGLVLPSAIYIIKYVLSKYQIIFGGSLPSYLILYSTSNYFYVPKTSYIVFCLPLLAVSIGLILNNSKELKKNLIYILSILMVFFIFYQENTKNGMLYGIMLYIIFSIILIAKTKLKKFRNIFIVLLVAIILITIFYKRNDAVVSFIADFKVAEKMEDDYWKYDGDKGYPLNEYGEVVSITNYMRASWAIAGLRMIKDEPLGYGLIERSFGELSKIRWKDSKLTQTHSGWIDLILGIGIPGFLLILIPIIFLILNLQLYEDNFYTIIGRWILISILLMWCTTELSQKIYFENLIFWISWASGVTLVSKKLKISEKLDS